MKKKNPPHNEVQGAKQPTKRKTKILFAVRITRKGSKTQVFSLQDAGGYQ